MDFTKGEISELKLRLIAFATGLGPLIASIDVCDQQIRLHAEAISRSSPLKISPLVKFISGSSLSPATVLFFML
jgi:hypothetical protein